MRSLTQVISGRTITHLSSFTLVTYKQKFNWHFNTFKVTSKTESWSLVSESYFPYSYTSTFSNTWQVVLTAKEVEMTHKLFKNWYKFIYGRKADHRNWTMTEDDQKYCSNVMRKWWWEISDVVMRTLKMSGIMCTVNEQKAHQCL